MKKASGSGASSIGNSIFQIKKSCLYRIQHDGQLHILDLESRRIHRLENIAAFIFLQCDGSKTLEKVVVAAKKKFRLQHPDFSDLVSAFVERMIDLNLLISIKKSGKASASRHWLDGLDAIDLRYLAPGAIMAGATSASAGAVTGEVSSADGPDGLSTSDGYGSSFSSSSPDGP